MTVFLACFALYSSHLVAAPQVPLRLEQLQFVDASQRPLSFKAHKKRTLLVVTNNSLGQLKHLFVKDLQHEGFQVLFVSTGIAEAASSTRASLVETTGALGNAPAFLMFKKNGCLLKRGSGFPARAEILAFALAGLADAPGDIVTLGVDRIVKQKHFTDCAAACATMLLERIGVAVPREVIYEALDKGEGALVSMSELMHLFKETGVAAQGIRGKLAALRQEPAPVIVHLDGMHYAIVTAVTDHGVVVLNPAFGRQFYKTSRFLQSWKGIYFRTLPARDSTE